MHVSSVVQHLLQRVEQAGRAAGAIRIAAVRVRVGACAGISTRQLIEVFDQLANGTMAQGAYLRVERVELQASCDVCRARFQVVGYRFECPVCGSRRTRVVAGEELVLESLTVVTECDPSLTWTH